MASHQPSRKRWLVSGALGVAFVVGGILPSLLLHFYVRFGNGGESLVRDTVEMFLPDGSVCEDPVNAHTGKFDGSGALKRRCAIQSDPADPCRPGLLALRAEGDVNGCDPLVDLDRKHRNFNAFNRYPNALFR